jgi:hypothetical protein
MPVDRQGVLVRCLSSLEAAHIDAPIAVIVVAEPSVADAAVERVRSDCAGYGGLDIRILAHGHASALLSRLEQMGLSDLSEGVSLTSYGGIRNFALVYAAVMGYTEAIFIDDDEVIESEDFVERGCYGLGKLTRSDIMILVKTGYYIDRKGSYLASEKTAWYDRFWRQGHEFNQWIENAMSGSRLSQSNTACGGCLAVHREAYLRVPFDPWITRGEDLDYLLNVRMYGSDVWFDNTWEVRHLPPRERDEAARFGRDIFRWVYEYRKLEYSKTQIDLLQIQPKSLYPYPGTFLESAINRRIFLTALLRSAGMRNKRRGYMKNALSTRRQASDYAEKNCSKYFVFQHSWPEALAMLVEDAALRGVFGG